MLDLKKLFPQQLNDACLIENVYYDSQAVTKNSAFVALKGVKTDGHKFIEDAFKNGAKVVIVEEKNTDINGLQIVVPDTHYALSYISSQLFPLKRQMQFVGVTGTDGKTSTTVLVQELLSRLHIPTGYIGTNGILYQNTALNLNCTTPLAPELFCILADMSEKGTQVVSMEVSSHSLITQRVANLCFDYAVFTNFSRDHLDFHKTMEAYKQAKLLLFQQLTENGVAIINLDDAIAHEIVENVGDHRIYTYSLEERSADFFADDIIYEQDKGISFVVSFAGEKQKFYSQLLGEFNIYNSLVAIAIAIDLGFSLTEIADKFIDIKAIPGRMELFYDEQRDFSIIVDFGHAPNAIKNVLKIARKLAADKVTIVTGAVGDGDKEKRPLMAEAAIKYADKVIFTTDQPYSEDPEDIIQEMVQNIDATKYNILVSREEAIKTALDEAVSGEVIVIMGKGRESQIKYKDYAINFSDYEYVKSYIEKESKEIL